MRKITIERVTELINIIDNINAIPFEEIEWHLDDKPIQLDSKIVKEWKFIGLNNVDFVRSNYMSDKNA